MVTQKDIARRLGVSPSLVSRALSGKGATIGAAPKTIRKIRETARHLRYEPNAAALSLRGGATHTIGLVVSSFEDPFFGRIVAELQRLSHSAGYSLVISGFSGRNPDDADLREIVRHPLDGVILVGTQPRLGWVRTVLGSRMQAVQIGLGPRQATLHRVAIAEPIGCDALLHHLKGQGCSTVAWAGRAVYGHRKRLKTFRAAAARAGLRARNYPGFLVDDSGLHAGYNAAHSMLAALPLLPDALVCLDDEVAQGALRALSEKGVGVPDRIRVTGFDDLPSAAMLRPALTTVRQPIEKLVRRSFQVLLQPAHDSVVCEHMDPELIVRES